MSIKLKPAGKLIDHRCRSWAGILAYAGTRTRPKEVGDSLVLGKVSLPDAPNASFTAASMQLPLPSSENASNGGTAILWERMAWNSQFSGMYANGGVRTTKGSLFDKANLDVTYQRQDDCNKQMADLVKFAGEYKKNPEYARCADHFHG
jgi:OOP family OmpA-OmpF porin